MKIRQKNFAILDLGSNSFHLDIARVNARRIKKVHKLKEMVYLGRGINHNHNINDETLDKACQALQKFQKFLRSMSSSRVRIIGTSLLRRGKNADEFIQTAEKIIGHPIILIPGVKEAEYIYKGVNQYYKKAADEKIVVDIGGGSTEIVQGNRDKILARKSIKLGCGPLTDKYFPDGIITRKRWSAALDEVTQRVNSSLAPFRKIQNQQIIGTSGTIKGMYRGLKSMKKARKKRLDTHQLRHLKNYLLDAGHVENISLKKVKDRKKEIYPAGLAILTGISDVWGISRVNISKVALREGVLFTLYQRYQRERIWRPFRSLASSAQQPELA